MIETKAFYDYLVKNGVDSFYGVPDSLLKIFVLVLPHSPKEKHIITQMKEMRALAAGHYLATGKPALVYFKIVV